MDKMGERLAEVEKNLNVLQAESQPRKMEEEVGAKQIWKIETSLISQFFKTFTLDLEIVLKNWEIVLKRWETLFKVAHYDL